MDVEDTEMADATAPAQTNGEAEADDDASSGLSEGSGDDYVDPDDTARPPVEEGKDDDVFK